MIRLALDLTDALVCGGCGDGGDCGDVIVAGRENDLELFVELHFFVGNYVVWHAGVVLFVCRYSAGKQAL